MNSDETPCPVCGETIKTVARKCKHCGEWLGANPHAEAGTPPAPRAPTRLPEPIDDQDIADLLAHLVEGSLVVFDSESGRYGLLETFRQYARDRLLESGDGEK